MEECGHPRVRPGEILVLQSAVTCIYAHFLIASNNISCVYFESRVVTCESQFSSVAMRCLDSECSHNLLQCTCTSVAISSLCCMCIYSMCYYMCNARSVVT